MFLFGNFYLLPNLFIYRQIFFSVSLLQRSLVKKLYTVFGEIFMVLAACALVWPWSNIAFKSFSCSVDSGRISKQPRDSIGSFNATEILANTVIFILLLERRSMLLRPSEVISERTASCFIDRPFFILQALMRVPIVFFLPQ